MAQRQIILDQFNDVAGPEVTGQGNATCRSAATEA